MAGLIRREDIEQVREQTRIEEIVGQHVTLRSSGVGSLKGLCPFHDERTPSFNVRPHLGLWHCFGCGEGGDAIAFVQKIDHLEFSEAVAYLAQKCGVTLHYESGGKSTRGEEPGRRQRLLEAHRVAEEFYLEQLNSPQAAVGRGFLAERAFDQNMATQFGVGYAPPEWDALSRHLRSRGFTEAELTKSGLAVAGNRGLYDRFRDRLVWPIRDLTGATVGFGARRLNDDKDSPKYLNTPETPIYHKSQVLYGIDLAKRDIVKKRRIVIVEGYTDVMAAHVAGETTAVATCGTAFGSEHVQVVRRLIGDKADPAAGVVLTSGRAHGGEIIFTFDGDEAGRNAARKVYVEDQKFAAQTFVAVDKHGWDPCDLRLERGDAAVRQLVDSRIPLFEFVLHSVLDEMDLNTAEGRVGGLRASAPVLAGIRDVALRSEYIRQVAGWIGIEVSAVRTAVREAARPGRRQGGPASGGSLSRDKSQIYSNDPIARMERQALEALIQRPLDLVGSGFEDLDLEAYTVPMHRAVHEGIVAIGGLGRYLDLLGEAETEVGVGEQSVVLASRRWVDEIRATVDPLVGEALTELAVATMPHDGDQGIRDYCVGVMKALIRTSLTRQIADMRVKLQRMNADDPAYEEAFASLMEVDQRRRQMIEYSD